MTENRNPLVASEDWWAVWLAGLLIASVVLQLITGVPNVGASSCMPPESVRIKCECFTAVTRSRYGKGSTKWMRG